MLAASQICNQQEAAKSARVKSAGSMKSVKSAISKLDFLGNFCQILVKCWSNFFNYFANIMIYIYIYISLYLICNIMRVCTKKESDLGLFAGVGFIKGQARLTLVGRICGQSYSSDGSGTWFGAIESGSSCKVGRGCKCENVPLS